MEGKHTLSPAKEQRCGCLCIEIFSSQFSNAFFRIVIHSNCQLPPASSVPVLIICLKNSSTEIVVMMKRKILQLEVVALPDLFFLLQKSLREYYNSSSLPFLKITVHERHSSHLSRAHCSSHIALYQNCVTNCSAFSQTRNQLTSVGQRTRFWGGLY